AVEELLVVPVVLAAERIQAEKFYRRRIEPALRNLVIRELCARVRSVRQLHQRIRIVDFISGYGRLRKTEVAIQHRRTGHIGVLVVSRSLVVTLPAAQEESLVP